MAKGKTLIIGGGMAGLSAAIVLSSKGEDVTLLERHSTIGGKMRQQFVDGHPIDAGPTVLTMLWVFQRLFQRAGTELSSHLKLKPASTLARHAWQDGSRFDLHADLEETIDEIGNIFGRDNADGYRRFCKDSRSVFETLRGTFIAASRPGPVELTRRIGFWRMDRLLALKPFTTLGQALGSYFSDPRLRQLFGRYATYVGSSPYSAPATLMLIAHVEREGVWFPQGGIFRVASAMAKLAESCGAEILVGKDVTSIECKDGCAVLVTCRDGDLMKADRIIYCGDASALDAIIDGEGSTVPAPLKESDRSLSAITWAIRADVADFPLKHHNVFFGQDYRREFDMLFRDRTVPDDPTVYVCAQDRETHENPKTGDGERVLCLINAPAFGDQTRLDDEEISRCMQHALTTMERCGLALSTTQAAMQVTQPADFDRLFPGSGGALYGRASHGWMASFSRNGTKTRIPNLYLAGGSVHPGAGVPMATLSGMLAAEQILQDLAST